MSEEGQQTKVTELAGEPGVDELTAVLKEQGLAGVAKQYGIPVAQLDSIRNKYGVTLVEGGMADRPVYDPNPTTYGAYLFSFDGRMARGPYWLCTLAIMAVTIAFMAIGMAMGSVGVIYLSYFVVGWPSLAIGVKRCHDRDHKGLFLLLWAIPIIGGVWLLIELGFLRGTFGRNDYGPDPLG